MAAAACTVVISDVDCVNGARSTARSEGRMEEDVASDI